MNIKSILSCLLICLAGQAFSQTFSFECVCNPRLVNDTCDVCPTTTVLSRSFTGLLVYRNGTPYRWIDEPYTIRRQPGDFLEIWEQTPNPDKISISLFQTSFSTIQGFIDSVFCQCSNGGGGTDSLIQTISAGDGTGADKTIVLSNGGGAVVIRPGTNVTITRTADTLTINATGGAGNCGCCDSLLFFTNDDTANVAGLNVGQYYFLDSDNTYGGAWGLVKSVTEPVGFIGALPPGCLANVPDEPLQFFVSDAEAESSGGLSVGEYYLLAVANLYGMPSGLIKQKVEP